MGGYITTLGPRGPFTESVVRALDSSSFLSHFSHSHSEPPRVRCPFIHLLTLEVNVLSLPTFFLLISELLTMYSATLSLAALLGLASRFAAAALTTEAYNDPNTGIDFQRYATNEYSFGIAVPENPEADFIGQMVVPLTENAGWGAVSLGGGMLNNLLFVAWPNDEEIITTFRLAGAYANPDEYSGDVTALPIANGTFINSTHLSYTFLCQGCINDDSFDATAATPVFGYAVAATSPETASDPVSALTYHAKAFGQYGVNLDGAKSADYALWASWTSESPGVPGNPGGGNGTTPDLPTVTLNSTYDVIVVGGGPAGIIAAARIAESGASVLLVERGSANTVALGSDFSLPWNESLTPYDIPALGSSMTTLSGISLCSDTASTAGCLLGGSSSINGENFIHPPERDFDRWPAGWKWSDLSGAADRLYELNPGTTQPSDDGKYYNDEAYQVVSSVLNKEGFQEVDSIESPNEKNMVYSRPSWSISNHLRAGPARTYMPFAQALPNFTLRLNTKVTQLLRTGSTMTGVLALSEDGNSLLKINLNAGGKLVLGAGAMSTPRILWNSGIGRSDALNIVKQGSQTGVALPSESEWIDLPVGHNLQDHAQIKLNFNAKANFSAYDFDSIASSAVNADDLDLYYQGSGVITQAAQRMHLWTSYESAAADGRTRYVQGTVSAMESGIVTVRTFLTHGTTTVGELGISASGNTVLNTKPWLIDAEDRRAMAQFVQWWLDVTAAADSQMAYVDAEATADDIIASGVISGDHWVGSARMGVDDGRNANGTAVVDLDTKVYGTDNLFVVDASIHPDLPTGNTQAIIMVAAEHAAKKIADYKVPPSSNSSSPSFVARGLRRHMIRSAPIRLSKPGLY